MNETVLALNGVVTPVFTDYLLTGEGLLYVEVLGAFPASFEVAYALDAGDTYIVDPTITLTLEAVDAAAKRWAFIPKQRPVAVRARATGVGGNSQVRVRLFRPYPGSLS